MEYFDRIISIGQDCGVAGSLRNIKYKECSYPFDWNVTSLEFIITSFKENFKNFETIFNDCEKSGNGFLKYKNHIYFYHDDKQVNSNIIKKYSKRSLRLNALLNENKTVLFVRKCKTDSIKDVQVLKECIISSYPNLKFKILLINNIKEDITDDKIIHKYKEQSCFLTYRNDIYTHTNMEKAYGCVYEELENFDSVIFVQPKNRDNNEI